MRSKALAALSVVGIICGIANESHAALAQFDLVSGGTINSPAGYTQISCNFLSNTSTAFGTDATTGATFSIDNVGGYNAGNANEQLTTAGFYTFGNGGNEHNFTLSGLTPGALVTMYAISGWDGNGRGASVTVGNQTALAQAVGDPGNTPTLANYTQINAIPILVGLNGLVTGSITGHNDANDEGQLGAVVFNIDTSAIPEPTSMAALAGAGLIGLRRRRAR